MNMFDIVRTKRDAVDAIVERQRPKSHGASACAFTMRRDFWQYFAYIMVILYRRV